MKTNIVHSSEPILLLGGGEAQAETIALAKPYVSKCVAADGGANTALAQNIALDAVIGDFDSISEETQARLPKHALIKIDEQDSTDFDKALRHIEAPLILAVGFTGARIDHQLAAMNTLATHAARPCLIVGSLEVVFVCPPKLELDLPVGTVFSLFPMGPTMGTSRGLAWPIDGLEFAPWDRVGTSNRVSGPVTVEMDQPNMLVIVPIEHFETVIQAVLHATPWSSRAK